MSLRTLFQLPASYLMMGGLYLTGCQAEPKFEGRVLDIWDEPIEGATVVLSDLTERPLTDANGRFALPVVPGPHKIKAGREGYIQEHFDITLAEGSTPEPVLFQLYPKPEEAGFYAIGIEQYHRLEPIAIEQVSSDLEQYRGIKSLGGALTEGAQLRVVFHTPLKLDEVMRLELELFRLEHISDVNMLTPTGPTEVHLNLYQAKDKIDIEILPLRSKNDYLIQSKAPLEDGAYAFTTQAMLSTRDTAAFQEIPEPLRVAYALRVATP